MDRSDAIAGTCRERVRFDGQGRTLEGVLAYPFDETPAFAVLVAGPHPLLGGDSGNNVVDALLQSFADAGAVALAFDYSSIGASQEDGSDWAAAVSEFWTSGTIRDERAWVADTVSARKALRQWTDLPQMLVGYSFGAWAVAQSTGHGDPRAIVLISPNPRKHSFDELNRCAVPLLVIHSDNDFACTVDETVQWFDELPEPKTRLLIEAGEHFFRGNESSVARAAVDFVSSLMAERKA